MNTNTRTVYISHEYKKDHDIILSIVSACRSRLLEFFDVPENESNDFINGGNCGTFAYCVGMVLVKKFGIPVYPRDNDMHAWLIFDTGSHTVHIDSNTKSLDISIDLEKRYQPTDADGDYWYGRSMSFDTLLTHHIGLYDNSLMLFIKKYLESHNVEPSAFAKKYLDSAINRNKIDSKFLSKVIPTASKYINILDTNDYQKDGDKINMQISSIDNLRRFTEINIAKNTVIEIMDSTNHEHNGIYNHDDVIITRDLTFKCMSEYDSLFLSILRGRKTKRKRIHLLNGVTVHFKP